MDTAIDQFDDWDPYGRQPRRILVFPGFFDPPTKAHQALFRLVEASLSPDVFFIAAKGDKFEGEDAVMPYRYRIPLMALASRETADLVPSYTTLEAPGESAGKEISGVKWSDLVTIKDLGSGCSYYWAGVPSEPRTYEEMLYQVLTHDELSFDPEYDTLLMAVDYFEATRIVEEGIYESIRNLAELWWFPHGNEIDFEQQRDVDIPGFNRLLVDTTELAQISSRLVRTLYGQSDRKEEAHALVPDSIMKAKERVALLVYMGK